MPVAIVGFARDPSSRHRAARAAVTAPSASLIAALADRYRVERELGQGGMATVYLAEDLKHHRQVAIKVLRPEYAALIGAARFLAEIHTTARLNHPHILPLFDSGEVKLHDAGRTDGPQSALFYVMPVVDGESLRSRLDRESRLTVPDAVKLASEVASAIDYAHRQGVIHRDIKPENILLQDGRALVADFGIALAPSAHGDRLTETGMAIGTPQYMSPEQALGDRQVDARTDIYGIGVMLYESLTGDAPFHGPSAQAVVARVLTEKPEAPSRRRGGISTALDATVLKSIEKDPARRFQTGAEMQAALANALATPGRRIPGGKVLATAGGVALLGALVWFTRGRLAPDRRAAAHVPDTAAVRLVGEADGWAEKRNGAGCDQAITRYAKATQVDTMYARAWAGLAQTHALCALFGNNNPAQEFADARAASTRALQLDSLSAGAYTSRGMAHVFGDQDWPAAERDFKRAIALDSTRFQPHLFRAWYYLAIGRPDSAESSVREAKRLAPTANVVATRLATVLRIRGRPVEAAQELAEVLARDSMDGIARSERIDLELFTHQCKEGLADIKWLADHGLSRPGSLLQYAPALNNALYADCGQRARAQRFVDSVEAAAVKSPDSYIDGFSLATVYAALGDTARVYHWLDQAVTTHNWGVFFIGQVPVFHQYADQPSFQALMRRAHLGRN